VAYIYGLIVVALLFASLHYFTELKHSQKLSIALVALLIVLSAIGYNKYKTFKTDKMLSVIVKYKQGKTVNCDGVDVNSSRYSLSVGTYTFIGKENTPHYAEMISAADCE